MPFMTKQLFKEIMKRSRLRNNFLRNRTEENKILYNRQRNYCVSLLRKSKGGYYENLNIKNVTDNKLFWKSVKPLLSDKSRIRDRINISEKGEILKTESETAETLNSFFSNIVKNLNISRCSEFDPVTENIADQTFKEQLSDFLCTNINSSFKSSSFPFCLKMADVTPLQKKKVKLQTS